MAEETTTETPETPEAPASISDAITAALEPTLPVVETPVVETPAGDDEPADEDAEGEESEEGEEGEESEEGEEGEESKEGEGQERNPDGTFKSKEQKATEAAAAEAAKTGAKKTDAVNDPIPEEIKGRTRERMTALIDTVKQKDEVINNQNTVIAAVKNTGATPEEFSAMISYMGWVHSDEPASLEKARDMLMAELEGVCLKLGQPIPGVDLVSQHADIKAKFDAGQIDAETAQELALNRTRTQRANATATAARENANASQQATMDRNNAIQELDALGKQLQKDDPEYAARHAVLQPVLHSLGMLPPKQWKAAFLKAYQAVRLPAPGTSSSTAAPAKKPGTNQPLRANKSPSAGQNRQPTSLLDAVSAAVDSAGR